MKKSHTTFRLNAESLEKLKQEAKQKNITMNSLVNQIIDMYASWHMHAPKTGMIQVWKGVISDLLSGYTYPELEKIAKKNIELSAKDTALFLSSDFTFENLIENHKNWLIASGFPFKYEQNDSSYKIIMHLDMGKKWSFFVSKCLEGMFTKLKNVEVSFEVSEKSLIMVAKKPT